MESNRVLTIHDYVEFVKEDHARLYREQSAAEVLLKARTPQIQDWNSVLKAGGYHAVQIRRGEWEEMHQWFKKHIGETHYTWTGSIFWFETEEAALWASLKWS